MYNFRVIRPLFKCFLSLLLLAVTTVGHAQSAAVLWKEAASLLAANDSDTATYFLPDFVRQRCGADVRCRIETYTYFQDTLEYSFQLPGAVLMAEELVREAGIVDSTRLEGVAHLDLFRFYGALGFSELATDNLTRSLPLLRRSGDDYLYRVASLFDLNNRKGELSIAERKDRFQAIQRRARAAGDARMVAKVYEALIELGIEGADYSLIREASAPLDSIIAANDFGKNEHVYDAMIVEGKLAMALGAKDYPTVRRHYQELIDIYRSVESEWRLVNVYNRLAAFELERNRPRVAEELLTEGRRTAEPLQIADLLAVNYELNREIAERNRDVESAYRYLQKRIAAENELNARNAGFNVQNYLLRTEKDRLTAEKKNQDLALALQQEELIRYSRTVWLVGLLLVVAGIGLFLQQRSKRKLARQNALITSQAAELRAQGDAKTRFFANAGHELRTPLTLVLGPITSLADQPGLSTQQRHLLDIAVKNGRQLRRLTDEILDFSKLEAGELRVNPQATPLRAFLEELLAQFEGLAERDRLSYHYAVDLPTAATDQIDQTMYRRIVYNLVSNAFKFTPSGGRIDVRVDTKDEQLRLVVTDTGPGILPEDQSRIFDRYYQSEPGKHAASGSGIGLALVKEYLQLLDGRIELESTVGKGSVFRVILPTRLRAASPATAPLPMPATAHEWVKKEPARARLLVVEDNRDVRDYLLLLLGTDYELVAAENGRAALDQLRLHPEIDLVLSDIMMPVMDGFELLSRLKGDDTTRHLPVVLLTARAKAEDRLLALRTGVDEYLTKPFQEAELKAVIERLLDNQRARRETDAEEPVTEETTHLSASDAAWLTAFEAYVRSHYRRSDFSVAKLARHFTMSESTLLRQLKRLTGLTPSKYIQELRLTEGRALLLQGQYATVSEVAYAVGYADTRSFSRAYQKHFGVTPSAHLRS